MAQHSLFLMPPSALPTQVFVDYEPLATVVSQARCCSRFREHPPPPCGAHGGAIPDGCSPRVVLRSPLCNCLVPPFLGPPCPPLPLMCGVWGQGRGLRGRTIYIDDGALLLEVVATDLAAGCVRTIARPEIFLTFVDPGAGWSVSMVLQRERGGSIPPGVGWLGGWVSLRGGVEPMCTPPPLLGVSAVFSGPQGPPKVGCPSKPP